MIESVIGWVFALLVTAGMSALVLVFALKGAFIGKVFPTTVFLPGYVLAVRATVEYTILVVVVTAAAYAAGQLLVYAALRRYGLDAVSDRSYIALPESAVESVERYFEQYGGVVIFFTNLIPGVRGVQLLPAAAGEYPTGRLFAYTYSSTLAYHSVLVFVVVGSVSLIPL